MRYLPLLLLLLPSLVLASDNVGPDALYKRTIRAECEQRFNGTRGSCLCLEPWFKAIDQVHVCEHVMSYMNARLDIAIDQVHKSYSFGWWGYDGTEYLGVLGNQERTMYLVPHLAIFHQIEAHPWDDICSEVGNALLAAQTWMNEAAGEVEGLYASETYHRGLLGLPPLKKPTVPDFTN